MRQSCLEPERIRDAFNCRNSLFILQGRIKTAFGWAMQSMLALRRLLKKGDELSGRANRNASTGDNWRRQYVQGRRPTAPELTPD